MNHLTPVSMLAGLLLIAAQAEAQGNLRTLFVVRHDPNLIQLDAEMLEALLGPSAQRAAIAGLAGLPEDVKERFPLNVTIRSVGPGQQPAGVFVGRLTLTRPEDLEPEHARSANDALLTSLRASLDERLHLRPRETLARQLAKIEAQLEETAGAMSDRRLAESRREYAEQLHHELELTSRELHAQRSVVESLKDRLADARSHTDALEARRHDHVGEVARLRTEIEHFRQQLEQFHRLVAETPENDPKADSYRDKVRELPATLDALTRRATEQDASREAFAREQIAAEERLAQMSGALDAARVDLLRIESTRQALEKDAQRSSGSPRDPRDQHIIEHRLSTLERRREQLAERLASLRPVELEIWR